MVGKTLAHYRILALIGSGGMGVVYRAEDLKLGRHVALKLLNEEFANDSTRLRRFEREARTIAALRHPNIVTIYSVEEFEGRHFLILELLDGVSLDRKIRTKTPLHDLLQVAVPVAEALAAAHDAGIIHRDLKPENVMVESNRHVKVLDFGLAKPARDDSSFHNLEIRARLSPSSDRLTHDDRVLGTVPYMAPEQLQGKTQVRSDMFAFGSVLYELASGRLPFTGENSYDVIQSILNDPQKPLGELRPDLPTAFLRVVDLCLQKDPKKRYHSMHDVARALRAVDQRDREVSTKSVERQKTPIPLSRRPAIAAVLISLLLLGFFGIKAQFDSAEPASAPTEATVVPGEEVERPRFVAVSYFRNLTQDDRLLWLREGLSDLLVTDLSRSPDLRVLSMGRLREVLRNMDRLDDPELPVQAVREIRDQTGIDILVLGSFAQVGETIRVSVRLHDAKTGDIVATERVDIADEEELLQRIDNLTDSLRSALLSESEIDWRPLTPLADVTTSSSSAYRYFAEAGHLHLQGKGEQAILLYEKAVEIDPQFAMAWARLATVYHNQGDDVSHRRAAQEAIRLADRLTPRERAYVEGRFYTTRQETWERAVTAYQRGRELYPDAEELLGNLAHSHAVLRRYEEVVEVMQEYRRRGHTFAGNYSLYAWAEAALGRPEKALQILDEYRAAHPQAHQVRVFETKILLWENRLDEAAKVAEASLLEDQADAYISVCQIAVRRREWDRIEALARAMEESTGLWTARAAARCRAEAFAAQGRAEQAAAALRAGIETYPEPSGDRAVLFLELAALLDHLEDFDGAIEAARAARDADRRWGEIPGAAWEAVAEQARGDADAADRLLAEIDEAAAPLSHVPDVRIEQAWAHGRIALLRGDLDEALRLFQEAESLLPQKMLDHPTLRADLGRAFLFADLPEEAARRFQRVRRYVHFEKYHGRTDAAIESVLALQTLGRIYESQGDRGRARVSYRDFLDLWDGDEIYAQEVADARSFFARERE